VTQDGIVLAAETDSDLPQDADRLCHTCSQTFTSIDALYAHQNEVGHLELTQTPTGPGYLCWQPGCQKYFRTAVGVQSHHRDVHSSVSEYRFRCSDCRMAFKSADSLRSHSVCHQAAVQTSTPLDVFQTNSDQATVTAAERYRANLAAASSLALLGGEPGALEGFTASRQATTPTPTSAPGDTSPRGGRYVDDLKLDENYNSNLADTLMPATTKDAPAQVRGVPAGDSEYAGLKFKCHRCKVGFAKMSQLSAHNRTPAHRQGARMAEVAATTTTTTSVVPVAPAVVATAVGGQSLEKYRDPNRPFKCDVCRESFTQKNILLVHYNSVSHLHRLKQQQQQQQLVQPLGNATATTRQLTHATDDNTSDDGPPTRTDTEPLTSSTSNTVDNAELDVAQSCDVTGRVEKGQSESVVSSASVNSCVMTSSSESVVMASTVVTSPSVKVSSPTVVPVMTSLQSASTTGFDRKSVDRSGLKLVETQSTSVPLQSLQQQQQMQMFLSDMFQRQFLGSLMQPTPTPEMLSGMFGAGDATKSEPTDMTRSQAAVHHRTCPHTCYQCGAIFGSADHLSQHQLIQCPASRVTATRPDPLPSSSYKSRIQQVLLESIGFECVMQYNENRQKIRKNVDLNSASDNSTKPSNVDEKASSETSADREGQTTAPSEQVLEADESEAVKGGDLPELKRCKCSKCSKEFSSVWVLKAHEEEIHSTVLPVDSVEEFARQLRLHYDSRQTSAAGTTSESRPSSESSTAAVMRSVKKTEPVASTVVAPSSSRVTSGQLAADLAAMQHAAAQLMHLPLMMGMMGAASTPAAPAAAGILPMMLPLSPEFFGIPPTFPATVMDPATMMMLSQQQQRGLRTGGNSGAAAAAMPTPGVTVAAPPPAPHHQPPAPIKSARTRINDDQLAVLRAHFDINNSPSEEQIHAMSDRTGLPPKVIKHWFRNTLFKERQRNKDSPYNFSVPPATTLNLDDYERTAPTTKRVQPDAAASEPPAKVTALSLPETPVTDVTPSPSVVGRKMVAAPPLPPPGPGPGGGMMFQADMSAAAAAAALAGMCQLPPVFSPTTVQPALPPAPLNATPSSVEMHSHERRANRTRFTNHQIQVTRPVKRNEQKELKENVFKNQEA